MAVASKTPTHKLPAAKAELSLELSAAVEALNDPEKLKQRLDYTQGKSFEALWAGATAKRYNWAARLPAEAGRPTASSKPDSSSPRTSRTPCSQPR